MKHADLEKLWNCLQLVRSRRLRASARQDRARPPNPNRPGLGFGGHAAALRAVPNPAADSGSEAELCLGILRFRIGKGRPSSSWLPRCGADTDRLGAGGPAPHGPSEYVCTYVLHECMDCIAGCMGQAEDRNVQPVRLHYKYT